MSAPVEPSTRHRAVLGWLILVGALTHLFAVVGFVLWLVGVLR